MAPAFGLTRAPEERWLLELLRSALRPAPPDNVRPTPDLADWERFLSLARYHRVAPLLLQGLKGRDGGLLPAKVFDALQTLALESTARSLLIMDGLRDVASEFRRVGIPFIVLKGVALAKELYPDDRLRPCLDLDILIQRSSYGSAKALLAEIGFALAEPWLEQDKLAHFGEIEFIRRPGFPVLLDLHWDTLLASWEPHSLLTNEETWQRSRVLKLGTFSISVLAPEELLLYLALHLAFHHVFSGLVLFCDLALLLKKYGNGLDWQRVYSLASRSGGRRALDDSLAFARILLDVPLPDAIVQRLDAAPLHRRLIPTRSLLLGAGPPSQAIERYVKFLLIDGMSARVRALRAWWNSEKSFAGGGKVAQ